MISSFSMFLFPVATHGHLTSNSKDWQIGGGGCGGWLMCRSGAGKSSSARQPEAIFHVEEHGCDGSGRFSSWTTSLI